MTTINYQDYARCREIAAHAHRDHFRRDGQTPYFAGHLAPVAEPFVRRSEYLHACIAILHDSIEDKKITEQELRDRGLPCEVIAGVRAITKNPGEEYGAYLQRVMTNLAAWRVKIRDILHNLSDAPSLKQVRKYAGALQVLLNDDTPPEIYP